MNWLLRRIKKDKRAAPYSGSASVLTGKWAPLTIDNMYWLEYAEDVLDDLKDLRAGDRKRVLDKIDEQLLHEPKAETRNKKILRGLKPPWQHEEPVRELRIGTFRVYDDVNEAEQRVIIRALRKKPPHKTTEETL